jgi:hypothetical protein
VTVPIDGDDVLAAASACHGFLASAVAADWSVPVPDLDFTVASVVAHAVNGPLWYLLDLWTGTDEAAFDLRVRADVSNAALLVSMRGAARVCALSVDAAPAGQVGYHPAGAADSSGFAAMACDELLVHTEDAARGLGLSFAPDPDLAGRVLADAAVGQRPPRPARTRPPAGLAVALPPAGRLGRAQWR